MVGEVYEPGTLKFQESSTIEEYIKMAGGTTNYALTKNIYLLKADGSVKFYRSNVVKRLMSFEAASVGLVEPGDAIVVPTNLDYEAPLTRVSTIANVVFQSLTSVAAFLSIAQQ